MKFDTFFLKQEKYWNWFVEPFMSVEEEEEEVLF